MAETDIQPSAAEFERLPLDFIVATPLIAAVNAQSTSAQATRDFIQSLLKDNKPLTVDFCVELQDNTPAPTGGAPVMVCKKININAPLLALVPVPHLRIDSVTTSFKYEISQVVKTTRAREASVEVGAQTGAALSPWVNATLKGSLSSRSSEESTMNRSGVLEITVHASEAPMPEGLAKILGVMANSIVATPAT